MFAQVHCPQNLSADDLDRYLAQGWFRMGQTIFTTNFLNFKRNFYNAIWLRIDLEEFFADRTQQKLFRLNHDFRAEFRPLLLDQAKEDLYALYKHAISFEASATLHHLLFRESRYNIFNTWEVNVYDGDRLIATGLFDLGNRSAAGIISFYDPAYRKYSLGKYLIYLKIHYCKNGGLKYFYPGYFVPGYYSFDYKLGIARPAQQYFDLMDNRWLSIDQFRISSAPLHLMHDRLDTLLAFFRDSGLACRLLKYELFDVGLAPELSGASLFDYPLLVYPPLPGGPTDPVIGFDVRDQQFHLMRCRIVYNPGLEDPHDSYMYNLLMVEKELFATPSAEEMVRRAMPEFTFKPSLKS